VRSDIVQVLNRVTATRKPLGAVLRALNPNDYECEPTAYYTNDAALFAKLTPAENATIYDLIDYGVDVWPFFMPFFSKTYVGSDTFYPNKQQGTEFAKRFKDAKSFWNTYQSGEITVSAVSGKSFSDDANLRPVLKWLYNIGETQAQELIDMVQDAFAKYPKIGYDFPWWTTVAFAYPDEPSVPEFKGVPVIAYGDGMTVFFESQGIEDAGPDMLFFHEFSHMVQLAVLPSIRDDGRTPEITRYFELMADAMAAYIGHHPRGASFQTKRIAQFAQVTSLIGDCYFDSPYHHGTPKQRTKAVYFGTDLVDNSKAKGHILTAAEFIAQFNKTYPSLVAPDMV
jgi:hypothetical protein